VQEGLLKASYTFLPIENDIAVCQPWRMPSLRMVAAVFAVFSALGAAQQPQPSQQQQPQPIEQPTHVIVVATDQAGNGVAGAYVSAQPSGGSAERNAQTRAAANGDAALDLMPGSYSLVVMDGCSMMWRQQIEVSGPVGIDIAVNAILKPGGIIDCVEVAMAAPDMQLLAAHPDARIPLHEVKVLPVSTRRKRRL
jgi:hypothetical protein